MRALSRRPYFASLVLALLAVCAPLPVAAGVIIGATSVTSPQGDMGGGLALVNIINQSGLSAAYTGGVTDFATFTASTTHSGGFTGVTGFTATESNGPQQFTFDLGSLMTIDGIAIWNTTSVGAVSSFSLLSDIDNNFGNGTSGILLGSTALATSAGTQSAQVFGFAATSTQFIHINGLTSLQPPDFYGLGEVVFSQGSTVPEPTTALLLSLGLAGLGFSKRRKEA